MSYTKSYKANNVEDVEIIYSLLREKYPKKQIIIDYNYDTKKYLINLTNEDFKSNPEIKIDVSIVTIYGDTDSVFLQLKFNRDNFRKNREDTFKLASLCGDIISDEIFKRPPIFLEFEKVFQPFILLTKKRYIGKKYEDTKDPFKLKAIIKSGIAVTRRDYCKMVKKCYTEVIDCIVDENNDSIDNISQSIEIYKRYVDRIDNYQIDFDDLIVSAMLAKSYKTRPVHVQLAEKLKERKEEVQVGDRIQYMYIENTSNEIKKKSELGEDPIYAKKNGLKYNRGCYLSQLAKPLLGFFKVILSNHQELLEDLIESTNTKLIEYGEPKLKSTDYILPGSKDDVEE
jgi:DNA polymerase elongation subunit (family B)